MPPFDDALSGLAKSAAIVFIGSVLGRLLSLLGQILIVRSLSPASFGNVALAYTIISTAGALALLGVHEGVTRLMSGGNTLEYQRDILRSGYFFALVSSTAIAIVLYTMRYRLGRYLNDERLPELLVLFLPFLLAHTIARVSFGAIRARKQSLAAVITRDFGPRIGALLLLGLFSFTGEALLGAVAYWVVTPVITMILTIYVLHRELSIQKVINQLPDFETSRELWSFSWPLAVSTSFFILLSNIDVIMISYFLHPQSVGLYRAIQPLRQITTFVLVAFAFLFLPIATEYYNEGNFDALNRFYKVTTKWIVAMTFPPVLIFTLFAPNVIQVIFGGEYTSAAPALAVLTAGLFVRALVGLNGDMTKAINRPKIELYSVIVAVPINIGLNFILIPRYGIVGAAAATVVGYIVYNALEVVTIYLAVGSHPFSIDNIKPLAPTLIFALVFMRLTSSHRFTILTLLLSGGILFLVHVLSMFLTRSLGPADLFLFERFEDRIGLDLTRAKAIVQKYY